MLMGSKLKLLAWINCSDSRENVPNWIVDESRAPTSRANHATAIFDCINLLTKVSNKTVSCHTTTKWRHSLTLFPCFIFGSSREREGGGNSKQKTEKKSHRFISIKKHYTPEKTLSLSVTTVSKAFILMNEICCDGKIEKGRKIKATTSSFSLSCGEAKRSHRHGKVSRISWTRGWLAACQTCSWRVSCSIP